MNLSGATGGLSGGCPHSAELVGAHTSSTTGERPMNSGQIVIKPASTFEPRFNLFRHKEMGDLCCAVPEDRPVPPFIRGERWEFAGAVGGRCAALGFERTEAGLSVRLNDFRLFQMIGPALKPQVSKDLLRLGAGRTGLPASPLSSTRMRGSSKRFRRSTFRAGGGEPGNCASRRLAGPLVS